MSAAINDELSWLADQELPDEGESEARLRSEGVINDDQSSQESQTADSEPRPELSPWQ